MTIKLVLILFTGIFLCTGCNRATESEPANPLDILLPYQQIEVMNTQDFREPSGLVFHTGRGTLFVIGDEGALAEFKPDGTSLKVGQPAKGDFEGITANPATGRLYAIDENKARIVEMNPDDFSVTGKFDIAPDFEDKVLLTEDNSRLEGIAFVPDPQHPHGGVFYLANQSTNTEAMLILKVEVPLNNNSDQRDTATITGYMAVPIPDMSDLSYNAKNGQLVVISDQANTIVELTTTGEILSAYALPGNNQEGIAIDNNGFLYLAQDSGDILKFQPLPPKNQPQQ